MPLLSLVGVDGVGRLDVGLDGGGGLDVVHLLHRRRALPRGQHGRSNRLQAWISIF